MDIYTKYTLEDLRKNDFNGIQSVIEFVDGKKISLHGLSIPKKPMLKSNPSSAEAREYANYLEVYEQEQAVYEVEKRKIINYNNKLHDLLVEYFHEDSGLNALPYSEEKKQKIYDYAMGTSDYRDTRFDNLCELVDIFKMH